MTNRFTWLRHVGAMCITALGVTGVFWLVLAMNAEVPEPPQKDASSELALQKVKKRTPPPKPKPKPKPKKAKRQAKNPAAPLPNIASALSGVDFGIPGLGDDVLGDTSNMLLDEASRSRDLVMSEGAVDRPPRPSAGNPAPRYPARAAKDGTTGLVVLKVLIGADGVVQKAKIVESSPPGVFDDAALGAVKRWRFEPALYEGQPVKVWARQPLEFRRS